MKAVAIPVPSTWRMRSPPRTEWLVADELALVLSGVQALPEDPPEWLRVEIARLAAGAPVTATALTRQLTADDWPAWIAHATIACRDSRPASSTAGEPCGVIGTDKLLLVMYQFLEFGAVATLRGPAAAFDAHHDAVMAVLSHAQIAWGDPPVTLAALLEGALPDRIPIKS